MDDKGKPGAGRHGPQIPARSADWQVAVSFHVLVNFSTGATGYYASAKDALRAVERVGPLDNWEIREIGDGKVFRVVVHGCGRSHDSTSTLQGR